MEQLFKLEHELRAGKHELGDEKSQVQVRLHLSFPELGYFQELELKVKQQAFILHSTPSKMQVVT